MNSIISLLIKEAKAQGWNLKALCQEAGFDQDHIGRWKRGEVSPRLDALESVLQILGYRLVVEPQIKHGTEDI